jgi:hypothetical protein
MLSNPSRKARKVVEQIVLPVLDAAGVKHVIVPTQYRGFATDHVSKLGESGSCQPALKMQILPLPTVLLYAVAMEWSAR